MNATDTPRKRWLVEGICFVPTSASVTVEAESEEEALKIAKEQWEKNKRSLIDSRSGDESAAFDWEPFALEVK